MLELLDKGTRNIFKILFIISLFLFFLAYLLLNYQLFSLALGILVSIINNILIYYFTYKIVYLRYLKRAMFLETSKRFLIYTLALYLIYQISFKYSNGNEILNLLLCTLGFLSFKLSLNIKNLFFKNF